MKGPVQSESRFIVPAGVTPRRLAFFEGRDRFGAAMQEVGERDSTRDHHGLPSVAGYAALTACAVCAPV